MYNKYFLNTEYSNDLFRIMAILHEYANGALFTSHNINVLLDKINVCFKITKLFTETHNEHTNCSNLDFLSQKNFDIFRNWMIVMPNMKIS